MRALHCHCPVGRHHHDAYYRQPPITGCVLGALRPAAGRAAQATGAPPVLAIVRAAENAGSAAYAARIRATAAQAGITCHEVPLDTRMDGAALCAQVAAVSAMPGVNGMIVLLPLPTGTNVPQVMAQMDPDKDVDCQQPLNLGRVMAGTPLYLPCTATAAVMLAQGMLGDLAGVNCAVIGASASVGRPLALQLLDRGRRWKSCISGPVTSRTMPVGHRSFRGCRPCRAGGCGMGVTRCGAG